MVGAREPRRVCWEAVVAMPRLLAQVVYPVAASMPLVEQARHLVAGVPEERLDTHGRETHGDHTRGHVAEVQVEAVRAVAVPLARARAAQRSAEAAALREDGTRSRPRLNWCGSTPRFHGLGAAPRHRAHEGACLHELLRVVVWVQHPPLSRQGPPQGLCAWAAAARPANARDMRRRGACRHRRQHAGRRAAGQGRGIAAAR
mmetsp:Transcript_43075/g.130127  ORF Transcript_43075/g.130127 Transcript_43075/m.130127 type:complete len:202 (+) Transcript_43075:296-901(+)